MSMRLFGVIVLSTIVAVATGCGGSKGDAGPAGARGDAGPAGPKGDTGPAGPKGDAGPSGPQGAAGPAGSPGDAGTAGKNGTTWLTGSSAPNAANGADGDLYLDTTTGELYQKQGGAWTLLIDLSVGAAGTSWLTGASAPGSALGSNGDLYLDTTTNDVYKKSTTGWAIIAHLTGAPGDAGANGANGSNGANGTNGATWFTGTTVPAGTLGSSGDLYLDTVTNDVYQKSAAGWAVIANLKGAPGDAGANGANGANGSNGATWLTGTAAPLATQGNVGDLYLDTATDGVYVKAVAGWALVTNLKGAPRDAGAPGAPGTQYLTGYGSPGSASGNVGDLYVDLATGNLFKQTGSGWTFIDNLRMTGATMGGWLWSAFGYGDNTNTGVLVANTPDYVSAQLHAGAGGAGVVFHMGAPAVIEDLVGRELTFDLALAGSTSTPININVELGGTSGCSFPITATPGKAHYAVDLNHAPSACWGNFSVSTFQPNTVDTVSFELPNQSAATPIRTTAFTLSNVSLQWIGTCNGVNWLPVSGLTMDPTCSGYGTFGPYQGYVYTVSDQNNGGTSTICPACDTSGCRPPVTNELCAAGTATRVLGNDYSTHWGAVLGWNLAQPQANCVAGAPGNADLNGQIITASVSNPPAAFRIHLNVADSTKNYCVNISGASSIAVPVSLFKDQCWLGASATPITAIDAATVISLEFSVLTNPSADVPFDFCVTSLALAPNTVTPPTTPTVSVSGTSAFNAAPLTFGENYWCWNNIYGDYVTPIESSVAALGIKALRAGGHNNDVNGGDVNGTYANDPFSNAQVNSYVAYSRDIGAEPMLQVPLLKDNAGNPATSSTAAAMVTYANVTKHYGIKYWIIGNEPDLYPGNDEPSNYTVADYCAAATAAAAAMRAVDASITILGPEVSQPTSAWLAPILSNCGSVFDVITVHRYPYAPTNTTLANVTNDATSFRSTIDAVRTAMANSGLSSRPLGITETNITWDGNPSNPVLSASPGTFFAGLWGADVLGVALENKLWTLDFWSLSEAWTLGMYDTSGTPRPLAQVFGLLAQHWATSVLAITQAPLGVSAYASRDTAAQKTVVLLINWNPYDSTQMVGFSGLSVTLGNVTVSTPAYSVTLVSVPDGGGATQAWRYMQADADAGRGPQAVTLP